MNTTKLSPGTEAIITELESHEDSNVKDLALKLRGICQRRDKILALVQESLGELRLELAYLIFDLECTRRERDESRKKHD
jgi:hypothetical protein